jgi:hypothetical protein
MWNEKGETLEGPAIEREILSWKLAAEDQNLSAAAKKLPKAQRAQLPANERLARRQAAHIIFSVPANGKSDVQRLRQSVDASLQETIGTAGFRYVYTIHTEHSTRPHAHVIVKAASEPFRQNGRQATRQLRLGPRELDAMRQVFTRHCHQQGLNVTATRREDRAELRAAILAGGAPLRENMNLHQAMRQTRQGRNFERSAPDWYKKHGFAYERRRLAAVSSPTGNSSVAPVTVSIEPAKPARQGFLSALFRRSATEQRSADSSGSSQAAPEKPIRRAGFFRNFVNYRKGAERAAATAQLTSDPADARIKAHFVATHRDPIAAFERFKALARELQTRGRGLGLAIWAANNHSIAFGEPTGAIGPGLTRSDVAEIIASRRHQQLPQPSNSARAALDPVFQAERAAVREAMHRARSEQRARTVAPRVARSLTRLAGRIETETPTDPGRNDRANAIRRIAEAALIEKKRGRDGNTDPHHLVENESKRAQLYKDLDGQIRRRDQARGRRGSDRDRDDGRAR